MGEHSTQEQKPIYGSRTTKAYSDFQKDESAMCIIPPYKMKCS